MSTIPLFTRKREYHSKTILVFQYTEPIPILAFQYTEPIPILAFQYRTHSHPVIPVYRTHSHPGVPVYRTHSHTTCHSIVPILAFQYTEPIPTLSFHRVWRPGPEDDAWKRRYLEAWFIHFQDMVERGLMEQISGKEIPTPGVYLQQMPYPCYKLDR